jgi:hypothetical protein
MLIPSSNPLSPSPSTLMQAAELAFEARPEKLVLIQNESIIFLSGIGPYQYSPTILQAFLAANFSSGAAGAAAWSDAGVL